MFYVYESYQDLIEHFETEISKKDKRTHHLLFGDNVQLCLDVDVDSYCIDDWHGLELTV